jgi:hypothetical protein
VASSRLRFTGAVNVALSFSPFGLVSKLRKCMTRTTSRLTLRVDRTYEICEVVSWNLNGGRSSSRVLCLTGDFSRSAQREDSSSRRPKSVAFRRLAWT